VSILQVFLIIFLSSSFSPCLSPCSFPANCCFRVFSRTLPPPRCCRHVVLAAGRLEALIIDHCSSVGPPFVCSASAYLQSFLRAQQHNQRSILCFCSTVFMVVVHSVCLLNWVLRNDEEFTASAIAIASVIIA